ncbi:MAG: PqqD family protein [Pirellulales bacterium]
MTSAARRRADVEVFVQFSRRRRVWNLKDPLALRYYQLNDEEFWLYEQLDGKRSIRELCAEFGRRFAPRRLAEQTLAGFLQQLHQVGLIVVDAPLQAEALVRRSRTARDAERNQLWTRLFTWKLRGVDPEPLLRRLYLWVRPWFSRAALWCAMLFVAAAGLTALVHGGELLRQASRLEVMLRPENALLLVAVIGAVKIVHELGHALACKHFGGECHEMGVTIYLFMPALYCNVSDAWTFPGKWSRAAVGAAGIAVELLLAAAAVFLWRWSIRAFFKRRASM